MMLQTTVLSSWLFVVILQLLTQEVTSHYHANQALHFLCDPRETSPYVRDIPWDCSAYLVCLRGHAIPTQCPPDKLFSGKGRGHKCMDAATVNATRCHGQIFNFIKHICAANPTAKIPSPEMCHTYLDCNNMAAGTEGAAEFVDYLLECPYPDLFSADTGECQHFSFVRCKHRQEPKAPCDYFQYLQLYHCTNKDCSVCTQHHPSCMGLTDGPHPVPGRKSLRMDCKAERTISITPCPDGYFFSSVSKTCESA